MKRFAIIAVGIVMACAVAVVILSRWGGAGPARLTAGAPMPPPDGYIVLCATRLDLCRSPAPRVGRLSAGQVTMLDTVNAEVNRRIIQRPDGANDVWQVAAAEGDCEDIALAKRAALIGRGFPADRLSIAIAYLQEDGRHAVLIAHLDDGDMILDNRFDYLLPVSKAGWRWISMQSAVAPLAWFEVVT